MESPVAALNSWPSERPSYISIHTTPQGHYITDSMGRKILYLGKGPIELPEHPTWREGN